MNELEACPYCGGEADCNNSGIQDKDGNALWWVECINCGMATHGHTNKNEAIAAWNCRADDWVSVDERLPKALTLNLVCCAGIENSVLIAQFNGQKWYRNNHEINITHWKHLPEPPKGE